MIEIGVVNVADVGGEDDGHDDAVDGDDFAEDDGDQVLRSYPGCLDASTDNGHTSCPDTPVAMSEARLAVFASTSIFKPGNMKNDR